VALLFEERKSSILPTISDRCLHCGFLLSETKLAIELDGGQHYEEAALRYDRARTAFLNDCGIKVLRFTNDDVDKNLRGVVTIIKSAIDLK